MESDSLFKQLFPKNLSNEMIVSPNDFNCLRLLMSNHDSFCGRFDYYTLKYVTHFLQTFETKNQYNVGMIALKIMMSCQNKM